MRLLFFVLFAGANIGWAQEFDAISLTNYKLLDYNNTIPEDLLSVRSAVLVHSPYSPDRGKQEPWKEEAQLTHRVLKEAGIDAVAYFNFLDFFAGRDVTRRYSNLLKKRRIKYLILLGEDAEGYELILTEFNLTDSVLNHGQSAWRFKSPELVKALNQLANDTYRAELPRENHLINDVPEFFSSQRVIERNRFEEYTRDLRTDKLAIPRFSIINLPADYPSNSINDQLIMRIKKRNELAKEGNVRLKEIISAYSGKYEFIEPGMTDKEIWDAGYQFTLKQLYTKGKSIRKMFGYEIDDTRTDYVSVRKTDETGRVKTIPVNRPVFKYYVKHVYNNDVFLGSDWDADTEWHEAFMNFIINQDRTLK